MAHARAPTAKHNRKEIRGHVVYSARTAQHERSRCRESVLCPGAGGDAVAEQTKNREVDFDKKQRG